MRAPQHRGNGRRHQSSPPKYGPRRRPVTSEPPTVEQQLCSLLYSSPELARQFLNLLEFLSVLTDRMFAPLLFNSSSTSETNCTSWPLSFLACSCRCFKSLADAGGANGESVRMPSRGLAPRVPPPPWARLESTQKQTSNVMTRKCRMLHSNAGRRSANGDPRRDLLTGQEGTCPLGEDAGLTLPELEGC